MNWWPLEYILGRGSAEVVLLFVSFSLTLVRIWQNMSGPDKSWKIILEARNVPRSQQSGPILPNNLGAIWTKTNFSSPDKIGIVVPGLVLSRLVETSPQTFWRNGKFLLEVDWVGPNTILTSDSIPRSRRGLRSHTMQVEWSKLSSSNPPSLENSKGTDLISITSACVE